MLSNERNVHLQGGEIMDFSMPPESACKSSCVVKRVQPSGKIEARLEVVMGDTELQVKELREITFRQFSELDSAIKEYETPKEV